MNNIAEPPADSKRKGLHGTMAIVRKHVLYKGRVQGVGFRYTAENIARDFPIAGHVRNLPDGRVELVVEGEESDVTKFLCAVNTRWSGNITAADVMDEPAQGLTGFRITR